MPTGAGKLAIAGALVAILSGHAHAQCRLSLALGLDVSSSVNQSEYQLQLMGLAAAIESPKVVEALLVDETTHVMSITYEWSGYSHQVQVTGWHRLDSEAAIGSYAATLRRHIRSRSDQATALGKGVEFGGRLLADGPDCWRRTLDISGDGVNNIGIDPYYFYRQPYFQDITVNGLAILGAHPDPLPYYQQQVKNGPEAFIAIAANFDDYRRAIEEKLYREITTQLFLGAAEVDKE